MTYAYIREFPDGRRYYYQSDIATGRATRESTSCETVIVWWGDEEGAA
jgi:hypothetical protein